MVGARCMVPRPMFCWSQEAEPPSGVPFWALVWGLPQALASQTPLSQGNIFPLTPNSSVWEETGQGWAPLWNPPTPTLRLPQSRSGARPRQFGAAVVLPRPPHPASCKGLSQQAQKIRRTILGSGEEKPQQLPPNWHSKQLEASEHRNELNQLFSPSRVEYRLQVSTQVTP